MSADQVLEDVQVNNETEGVYLEFEGDGFGCGGLLTHEQAASLFFELYDELDLEVTLGE